MKSEFKVSPAVRLLLHLHRHTQYSTLDEACRTKAEANRAKELGMPAVAMADDRSLNGPISLCKVEGNKPILGCKIYPTLGPMEDKKGSCGIFVTATHEMSLERYQLDR